MQHQTLYYHRVRWSTRWLFFVQAFHYSLHSLTFWQILSALSITTSSNVPPLTHSSALFLQEQATWYLNSSNEPQTPYNHLARFELSNQHAHHGQVPWMHSNAHILNTWVCESSGETLNAICESTIRVSHYHRPAIHKATRRVDNCTHLMGSALQKPINPAAVSQPLHSTLFQMNLAPKAILTMGPGTPFSDPRIRHAGDWPRGNSNGQGKSGNQYISYGQEDLWWRSPLQSVPRSHQSSQSTLLFHRILETDHQIHWNPLSQVTSWSSIQQRRMQDSWPLFLHLWMNDVQSNLCDGVTRYQNGKNPPSPHHMVGGFSIFISR